MCYVFHRYVVFKEPYAMKVACKVREKVLSPLRLGFLCLRLQCVPPDNLGDMGSELITMDDAH